MVGRGLRTSYPYGEDHCIQNDELCRMDARQTTGSVISTNTRWTDI